MSKVEMGREQLNNFSRETIHDATMIRRIDIESFIKFTLSLSCLLFFFVGAPLGAIIRKGGLGTPVIISIFFYLIYYIIDIIGRNDRTAFRRASVKDLAAGLKGFTILLDHQPYHLEEAEQAGIDFQFSGHTHRGQIWPISWITDEVYEKSWGRHQRGNTHYYISSGLGIWGPKIRIGTQSEYLVLTLRQG